MERDGNQSTKYSKKKLSKSFVKAYKMRQL